MSEGGTHPAGVKKHPLCFLHGKNSSFLRFLTSSLIVIWIYCASMTSGVKAFNIGDSNHLHDLVHDHKTCSHRHPRPHEVRPGFDYYFEITTKVESRNVTVKQLPS